MYGHFGQTLRELRMPDPEQEVMPRVHWGRFDQLFTPAFWYGQAWLDSEAKAFSSYRIGTTLKEEIAACLLGGHGIPAEIGLAAYRAVRCSGVLDLATTTTHDFYSILQQSFEVNGRKVRYRFAKQKADYLCSTLNRVNSVPPPTHGALAFRDYFLTCKGIGPKTASWITRNWLDSPEVAIIDIHIHRAGLLCGVFKESHQVSRDYFQMETRFIDFSKALEVRASYLDALIWKHMKTAGNAISHVFRKINNSKQIDLFR